MSTKIIAWSMRRQRALTRGVQFPMWYVELVPNRPASDRANNAVAIFADTPPLMATSVIPAGIER